MSRATPQTGADLIEILEAEGWTRLRQTGGHVILQHRNGCKHTIARSITGRNIHNAIADLRRRGLVDPNSQLARQEKKEKEGDAMTTTTVASVTLDSKPERKAGATQALVQAGVPLEDIARQRGISVKSVERIARHIPDRQPEGKLWRTWTKEEDQILRDEYRKTNTIDLADLLDRTIRSIEMRASRLGLTVNPNKKESAPVATTVAPTPTPTPAVAPTPVATPAESGYALHIRYTAQGWRVTSDGLTRGVTSRHLLDALVGMSVNIAEDIIGWPVPTDTQQALAKALSQRR